MKKVSVIIPAYNAEVTLARCLDSVLAQKYLNLEIFVIDDKSDDATLIIAKKYEQHHSNIFIIKAEANGGAGAARNLGIEAATGQYIAFLDADDMWHPDKIIQQVEVLETTGNFMVVGAYEVVNSDGNIIGVRRPPSEITYKTLLKHNCIGCLTVMYSVSKIGKHYFPKIRKRQDYALWLTLAKNYGAITADKQVVASYTMQAKSLSSNKLEMLKWNYLMFRETQNFNVIFALFCTFLNSTHKVLQLIRAKFAI